MASSTGVNGATSPDGITWTGSTSFPASNDLAVNGVVWVVGTASALGGGIAYSTDKGLTWSFAAVGNHRVATSGWSRIISAIANANARFMTGHVTGAANEVALPSVQFDGIASGGQHKPPPECLGLILYFLAPVLGQVEAWLRYRSGFVRVAQAQRQSGRLRLIGNVGRGRLTSDGDGATLRAAQGGRDTPR
jgi:hypothetical protein